MKKVFVILSALVLTATAASAQSWLDSFLKVATEKVGDVITGTSSAASFDIKGSWKYQGVAISASSENVLTSLATSAGAGTIEKKCDDLLAKAGIKAGAATLNFKEDGSFTLNAGKINLPGTWTKEGSKLTINFAKLFTFKLVGTIKTTSTGCQLLFDADKFVGFISKVLEVVNKVANNSTLASVQQMLANAKGVQLGFKLAK
ncbi:MAG: DUF4923 family protein [Bacteroidales bacterium]|jgi:hypothetical protein|nr:DUF4923 family protein [Bacteroidales bacterium]MBQ6820953.1 DUF4923 family protein [Bacteroidales bacterium]MBR0030214.1 DUF4923 family protein [Bacteroidales bacterium]MBR0292644.1 DUF4923 family protein [Bacteroidales bacterium]